MSGYEERKQEVIDKIHRLVAREFQSSYETAFFHYDSNKDLKISVPELTKILYDAEIGNRLTRWKWVKEIIDAIDTDEDDMITWEEFKKQLVPRTGGV